jgi:DNA modification methylase
MDKHYMPIKFPYREITLERALRDYVDLQNESTKEMTMREVGNKATDIFFQECRKRVIINKWSHFKAWQDKVQREKIRTTATETYKKDIKEMSNAQWMACMNLRYGAVAQFKPNVARYIYSKFKALNVLDFSAGWGGRCLAAMSLNINYIGIDINTCLKKPYLNMFKNYKSSSKIKMIYKPAESVDYSKLEYDFAFTSPPYNDLEKYENMKDYKNFNDEFLFPVIKDVFKHLPNNKWFGVNVPISIYTDIVKILGVCTKKMELKKAKRAGNAAGYKEYCYFWLKGDKVKNKRKTQKRKN